MQSCIHAFMHSCIHAIILLNFIKKKVNEEKVYVFGKKKKCLNVYVNKKKKLCLSLYEKKKYYVLNF